MNDPHGEMPVLEAGRQLADASTAIILLHGRGASAEDILELGYELGGMDAALLAPQAAGHTWYPYSFLAPISQNEPWLGSAIKKIESVVKQCESAGLTSDRIVIAGFSQGACLATEFVARHPARYGAVLAFTGGLIGPPETDLHHAGSLAGTPVLMSSGDPDPHVPWQRVEDSARELERMGARVERMRHQGRPHTILRREVEAAKKVLAEMHAAKAR
jgi:predicted esterase